jgi:hypothetical protein
VHCQLDGTGAPLAISGVVILDGDKTYIKFYINFLHKIYIKFSYKILTYILRIILCMPVQVVCHEVYVLLSCFLVRGKGTVTKQGRVSEVVFQGTMKSFSCKALNKNVNFM